MTPAQGEISALDALQRVAAQIATLPHFALASDPAEEGLVYREAVWAVLTDAIDGLLPPSLQRRRLLVRYLALPFMVGHRVAQSLGLLVDPDDRGVDDVTLAGRICDRARRRGCVVELGRALDAAHAEEAADGV